MRICLVAREVAPFIGGGIATYAAQMARALAAAGHDVHILTAPYPDLRAKASQHLPGITLHAVDVRKGDAALPGAYFSEAAQYAMAALEALRELHRLTPFDYIELPEYRGEGFWILRAKRTLGDFHGAVLGVRMHTPLYLCRRADRVAALDLEVAHIEHMEKRSIAEAELLLSASHAMMRQARADLGDWWPDDHRQTRAVLPLPIDLSEIERDLGAGRAEHGENGEQIILYFGRLQFLKGVVDLVDAAQMLLEKGLNIRLRLIGGDTLTGPFGRSMLEHLKKRIEPRNAARISFEGPRPRADLSRAIRGAAVCCFPSHWESFSMACLEAMALGAVTVVGDGGSLPELVDPGRTGLIAKAGDPASLAETLERALSDATLRESAARLGPARAHELSHDEHIVDKLIGLVEQTRQRLNAGVAKNVEKRPEGGDRIPTLSVIVPFYNLGDYLPATLASIEAQTFKDFELLIIDDGSTDPKSLRLLDDLRAKGYRVLHKPNGGLGSARNWGVKHARAQWILPVDADDLFDPRMFETLVEAKRRNPDLVSISPMFKSFVESPDKPVSGFVPLGYDRDLLMHHNIVGPGGGSLVEKRAILAVGGYDEWLTSYEDWDLWCRLAEHGFHGTTIPAFLLHYRLRPGSLIRAEALPRHQLLKAYILERHRGMAREPDRVARLQLAEAEAAKSRADHWRAESEKLGGKVKSLEAAVSQTLLRSAEVESTARDAARNGSHDDPLPAQMIEAAARQIIRENFRYRLADKLNTALKATGLQTIVKSVTLRAARVMPRRR
ncbi:MAG: glycosyltransferase [Phycisphaerales bacterium]|nr:glycosyltransferase [Phycisphaerales bacterium]